MHVYYEPTTRKQSTFAQTACLPCPQLRPQRICTSFQLSLALPASTSAHKQNQLSKCFLKGCACVHGLLHHCLDRDSQLHLLPASECSQIIQACIGGSCAYHRKSRQSRSHATGSDLCSRHAYFIMSLLMHAMSWYIVNCGHPGSGSVS